MRPRELPAGLAVARTAGPFDESSLPAGLRRNHRVADGTWAVVRDVSGSARFTMETMPAISVVLRSGDTHPIRPACSTH